MYKNKTKNVLVYKEPKTTAAKITICTFSLVLW